MTSFIGLPTRGSDVRVLISKVHLHQLCVLVEFWAKFRQDRTADYESLAKDIQSPENVFQEFEGNSGDQCLVQIDGTWFRSRIVSRNGFDYTVFLIDKGMTFNTSCSKLAWCKKTHFDLPPEVEFCVLANVLPLSSENRWTPLALEFLKTLSGRSVNAHVQDLLFPHGTFVLHIPCISKQMYEMGIAKKVPPDIFQHFVFVSLQSQSRTEVPPGIGATPKGEGERLNRQDVFLYPELQAGTAETVIVTDVTNPQRIFCQLRVFSQELKKLSEQITQCCEGRMTNSVINHEMIGFPCAARGNDNRWYRSVLQQVFPQNQLVEVLNVDYGTKQFVQMHNVLPLAPQFFRMPVVTYICSLYGVIDKGIGWTTSQIDYLRNLLLHKTIIAKFEYQSVSEGVHYVTLYGDQSINMNNLFASQATCLLESDETHGDYALRTTAYQQKNLVEQKREQEKTSEKEKRKAVAQKCLAEELSLNSTHLAAIQHVTDPSNFWIQTQNYANEFHEMMDCINHLYKDPVNNHELISPTVGLHCASKAEDGEFHRAIVAEVDVTKIKVFFLDYGNTEVVNRCNIRALPDKFKKLPFLALKCSLAGIRPNDGTWSQSACEFFSRLIKDKVLNVHVTAKFDEGYVVRLIDIESKGQKDLALLMCSSGFAEREEDERKPHAKRNIETGKVTTAQLPDASFSAEHGSGMPLQTLNTTGPTFKECMFTIGSVLDVSVSYIESPNDFWCQLVQNARLLKLLMHDIQVYYAGSECNPPVEMACVARHPDNRMWYRALIIHKHETPHFDVLFVDYGQTETISLFDVRKICPQFLTLESQAFRCSLLNPVDPTSATNEWNEEAVARFHNFVETAASDFLILKCTIYAVMYSELKIVFNIVDLETPFESVSTIIASPLKSVPPVKASGSSFRLDTYYYSTHHVKTGTEEQVTVTCVNHVGQFYCQLQRNADAIKELQIKVNTLCHQLEKVKLPTVFGRLCFAKYTDGKWYRGQIKATKPAIHVHFVDYGDTIEVEKSDLLPVPREAKDIMSLPVQAVVCCLADVPADVPSEMNKWFETSVTECKFRALIVAREPDGKLHVELYHGDTQINSTIKKKFRIEMHCEKMVIKQHWGVPHTQMNLKSVPKQVKDIDTTPFRNNLSASKPEAKLMDDENKLQSTPKPSRSLCENGHKVKNAPAKLYQPPHQRKAYVKMESNTGNYTTCANIKPRKVSHPAEMEHLVLPSSAPDTQLKYNVDTLPKLEDLPSKSITAGLEEDVYLSHCNSPLNFCVQLLRDENEIFSLVEKLNDPQFIPESDLIKEMQPGDLVRAEFSEDSSWYRAVVKEVQNDAMALVEFVDYGNTVLVPVSKIGRIHKSFLQLPVFSTKCMLSSAATLDKEKVLDPEVVSVLKDDIGGIGEKVLKCKFIRKSGSVWEVSLESGGVNLVCKLPALCAADGSEISPEKLEQLQEISEPKNSVNSQVLENSQLKSSPLCYPQQNFSEGQMLDVYITTTNDALTFWCQPAVSEQLDQITNGVAEVGNSVDHRHAPGCLSPGSPCIALYLDDDLWYRAQVIDKDGDELLVFFVDFGNSSKVRLTEVREIPRNLVENPPQAFWCELEGFDASQGSWESGAGDELSALTIDKCLKLTITQVRREEGKIKCLVHLESEGQVINETLKPWWRSSMTENEPAGVDVTTPYKTSKDYDQTQEAITPPGDPLKHQDLNAALVSDCTQKGQIYKRAFEEPVDCQTAGSGNTQENSPQNNEHFKDSVDLLSFLELPREKGQTLTTNDHNLNTEPLMLKTTDCLRDTVSIEEINTDPTTVLISYDEGKGKNMLPPQCNTSTEEGVASVMDTNEPDGLTYLLDENFNLDIDLMIMSNLESLPTEVCIHGGSDETSLTCGTDKVPKEKDAPMMKSNCQLEEDLSVASGESEASPRKFHSSNHKKSFNVTITDGSQEQHDEEDSFTRDSSTTRTTTVKMVPNEAIWPSESRDLFGLIDNTFEDLKQNDLLTEEETFDQHQDTYLHTYDLLADTKEDDGLGLACSASTQVSDLGIELVTCSSEEACLIDFCADPNELSYEEIAGDAGLSCVTGEEMFQPESLLLYRDLPDAPSSEAPSENDVQAGFISLQDEVLFIKTTEEDVTTPYEDEVSALQSDLQPQVCSFPCQDLNNLVEEVTCLVGEICLTDVCRETHQDTDTGDTEQMLNIVLEQEEVAVLTFQEKEAASHGKEPPKDFNDGLLEEDSSLSDDGFEDQLSKVTHLSLKVTDDSADVLPVEWRPEE